MQRLPRSESNTSDIINWGSMIGHEDMDSALAVREMPQLVPLEPAHMASLFQPGSLRRLYSNINASADIMDVVMGDSTEVFGAGVLPPAPGVGPPAHLPSLDSPERPGGARPPAPPPPSPPKCEGLLPLTPPRSPLLTKMSSAGPGGQAGAPSRGSGRVLTRRQSSTSRFNTVVQKLHETSRQEWKKQNCHYCGRCRPISDRITCKNQYCSLQGQRVKYICRLCYSHQKDYFGRRGIDVRNIIGDITSPDWYCPACIIWEDNCLPHPGVCCCSFRRNRIRCPLHIDGSCPSVKTEPKPTAGGAGATKKPTKRAPRSAKLNFHCKPYKQKTKGEFKTLKLDLKRIRIGSKPYMRVYAKSSIAAGADQAPAATASQALPPPNRKRKRVSFESSPAPPPDSGASSASASVEPMGVKVEDPGARQPQKRLKRLKRKLSSSHLWLQDMVIRNQLPLFVRSGASEDPAQAKKDAAERKFLQVTRDSEAKGKVDGRGRRRKPNALSRRLHSI